MAEALPPIPAPADGVDANFHTERLIKMFRAGLPDPDKEGNKPEHLKNFQIGNCRDHSQRGAKRRVRLRDSAGSPCDERKSPARARLRWLELGNK